MESYVALSMRERMMPFVELMADDDGSFQFFGGSKSLSQLFGLPSPRKTANVNSVQLFYVDING
jgi:hypothetical protein